jgi:hypothetical protein
MFYGFMLPGIHVMPLRFLLTLIHCVILHIHTFDTLLFHQIKFELSFFVSLFIYLFIYFF